MDSSRDSFATSQWKLLYNRGLIQSFYGISQIDTTYPWNNPWFFFCPHHRGSSHSCRCLQTMYTTSKLLQCCSWFQNSEHLQLQLLHTSSASCCCCCFCCDVGDSKMQNRCHLLLCDQLGRVAIYSASLCYFSLICFSFVSWSLCLSVTPLWLLCFISFGLWIWQ